MDEVESEAFSVGGLRMDASSVERLGMDASSVERLRMDASSDSSVGRMRATHPQWND